MEKAALLRLLLQRGDLGDVNIVAFSYALIADWKLTLINIEKGSTRLCGKK